MTDTSRIFAVIRSRGPSWNDAVSMESQAEWNVHAAFMNGLEAAGFIVMAGPLDNTPDVLLVVRAQDEAEVRDRLASDPWSENGLLRIARVHPWTLRLGSVGPGP